MSLFPEEPLDSPLGYFPGRLNQKLNNGRWTILRKLGWGPRSSCWLAVDSKDSGNIKAIKIYTAAATKDPSSTNERDSLQKMRDSDIIWFVSIQWDSFYEENEAGCHLCLILHCLGPSIKVVGDVLSALYSLHDKGIIHGAISPENILLPSFQQGHAIQEFISQNPSVPGEDVTDSEGKSYHIVRSQPLNTFDLKRESTAIDFARVDLTLSNFSHAQIQSDNVSLDPSSTFLPPEASIEGAKIDTKADIWMLGCTIYTLVIGRPPFGDSPGPLTREKVEEVTANIKNAISATKAMSPQDAKKTTSVIKVCMKFDPAERPSARHMVGFRWVKEGNMCSCGWCMSKALLVEFYITYFPKAYTRSLHRLNFQLVLLYYLYDRRWWWVS
ncbi:kinase-like domain-containing protein [Gymnopilus junonius]|uniref:non-specific serine/threonine protein kinase n=1 Tax=Gymnopilus junonius TaxID=109634 RepID=A0A9P5TKE9_GYMJU|nr:kinase-like domain-containing protein [Gymnopilus junonius]